MGPSCRVEVAEAHLHARSERRRGSGQESSLKIVAIIRKNIE
jgi:hypothetical protein